MTTRGSFEYFQSVFSNCKFGDWEFLVGCDDAAGQSFWLQVRATTPDNDQPGAFMSWGGRKWRLSPHMTTSELVQTAFMAVLAAVEHEAREQFTFHDRAVFGPHLDVLKIWELLGDNPHGALDVRPEPPAPPKQVVPSPMTRIDAYSAEAQRQEAWRLVELHNARAKALAFSNMYRGVAEEGE